MTQYTYQGVRELFMELFCITRTGISDPMIQHRRRTNFFVVEEGEMENEDGFWVIDEDTHEEGFVSLYTEDDFWVLGAKGYSRRRITGRRFKKGRPKGFKGKGKGKRPGFRTRSKGKGYAHYDEYQQQQTDPIFYGKFGKGKGKNGAGLATGIQGIYNWNSNFVVNLFLESHRKTDVCVMSIIFQ